jgi:dTDP-4-dehydrorhamnose reductase
MLGSDLVEELTRRGCQVTGVDLPEVDLTTPQTLQRFQQSDWGNLDWVVNCAAYTAVDKAEEEFWAAQKINGVVPGVLAAICKLRSWRFLHISTDFVFDGQAANPYTEDYATGPLGKYGVTKLMGEQNALKENPETVVVRTAWLYGPKGKSFPRTIIKAWLDGVQLKVVADQLGSPTYTADLARVLADMVLAGVRGGIYHAAGPDAMSWRDLAALACGSYATEVLKEERPVEIVSITTEQWPTLAKRPKYSVLSFAKTAGLGIEPMRSAPDAMVDFVRRLGPLE